jgi:hypothetical protein
MNTTRKLDCAERAQTKCHRNCIQNSNCTPYYICGHQRKEYLCVNMALDLLTALSVAGTVVQLADFGTKIFSASREL